MRRLRDEVNENDPRSRTAASLIRAISPLAEDVQRQRRVRLKLGSSRSRSLAPFSRPAIVVAILLASVGAAAAMAGGGWTYARQQVARLVSSETPARPRPTPRPRTVARAKLEPSQPPGTEPAAIQAPIQPTPATVERRDHRPDAKRRGVAERSPVPPQPSMIAGGPALVPTGPGAGLMIEAMQARRAGDLARTERLLTEYRTKYPNGELQEEALVLSLEAATLMGSDRAAGLARAYLARFPGGRFRDRVEQVLRTKPR
ncbi:MAG TPA: hypothetical protein VFH73_15855 [Polyangia bacterium]|nr:hypothetical protein [Polyangia bacterium]